MFKVIGVGIPFHDNETMQYSHSMNEFDNKGNDTSVAQYGEFENEINTLSIYTKWNKQEDGFYTRNIKTFEFNDITKERILNLLENSSSLLHIEDILGKPIIDKTERKTDIDLTKEENEDYLKATIYDVNKNDYIY